jgi:glycerol-3-phosphate dehydrogenase (NAD(P)+)
MKVSVMGSGAWGRALAGVVEKAGHEAILWSRHSITITPSDTAILAVPAQAVRQILPLIKAPLVISAAKGFERETGFSMAELSKTLRPDLEFYALSGPSFAADVTAGLPTAVTMAGKNLESTTYLASAITLPNFRIYASDDIVGVEIGGAMKNVLAIACGIVDGIGLGESARASLITRGFAELSRYGRKLGAKPETLMGLSGLGDLMLTASSSKSRNYTFGLAIGKGVSVEHALKNSVGVVEGAHTASIAAKLAIQHSVEMPIVAAVASIIMGHSNPQSEINKLLARPVGVEFE